VGGAPALRKDSIMQATANARRKTGSGQKGARAASSAAPENTLRATNVLGRRVIDSSNALILGVVDEIYFSFETRQIVALRVRAGFKTRIKAFFKGHKSRWVVPMHIVHRIGEYAVVIDREQAGIPIDPVSPTESEKKARPPQKPPAGSASMHALVGRRVVTDEGELIGRVVNIFLHEDSPIMQGFEIVTGGALGLGRRAQRLTAQARALGDVLLVPAHPQLTGPVPVPVLAAPARVSVTPAEPAPARVSVTPAESAPAEDAAPDWLC
jgi:sporulation protein YlmC with PRC-barrel domain